MKEETKNAMKITIENIESIGFQKHGLFTKESFIYQKELGQSYEIRIKFYAKGVKSNDKYFPTLIRHVLVKIF